VHYEDSSKPPRVLTKWAKARENYATSETEDELHWNMAALLDCVTLENPPYAPSVVLRKKVKTKTWHDIDGRPHQREVKKEPLTLGQIQIRIVGACGALWIILFFLFVVLGL
jgi:hypothetical protein